MKISKICVITHLDHANKNLKESSVLWDGGYINLKNKYIHIYIYTHRDIVATINVLPIFYSSKCFELWLHQNDPQPLAMFLRILGIKVQLFLEDHRLPPLTYLEVISTLVIYSVFWSSNHLCTTITVMQAL